MQKEEEVARLSLVLGTKLSLGQDRRLSLGSSRRLSLGQPRIAGWRSLRPRRKLSLGPELWLSLDSRLRILLGRHSADLLSSCKDVWGGCFACRIYAWSCSEEYSSNGEVVSVRMIVSVV